MKEKRRAIIQVAGIGDFGKTVNMIFKNPLKPRPDNFTPTSRTPWGGSRIARLKKDLGISQDLQIGESWEISSHPDFPSRFSLETREGIVERTLPELAKLDPTLSLPFLAKLLNAEDWLSVQVHPKPDYPGLKRGENSKTEAWHILEAEEGAGIYLGLKEGATAERVREALEKGRDLRVELHFVKVSPGETYLVPAGTPHAIGPGILLYEPQESSATTYRYYDFGRRDLQGRTRPLHIEDAIQSTDWGQPRGDALIRLLRRGSANVSCPEFRFERIEFGTGQEREDDSSRGPQGFTVVAGRALFQPGDRKREVLVSTGESVLLPTGVGRYRIVGEKEGSVLLKTEAG